MVISALFSTQEAYADRESTTSRCEGLLTPDVEILKSDHRIQDAFRFYASDQQINQSESRGNIGVNVPGIASGSADSADKRNQSISRIQSVRKDFDQTDAIYYVSNRVPSARSQQFLDCLNRSPLKVELAGPIRGRPNSRVTSRHFDRKALFSCSRRYFLLA